MTLKVDARLIQRRAQANLAVNVGDTALVEPQGVGERFKTSFLGWEAGRCVIIRLPAKLELRDHLYSGKLVIVRFLNCTGEVCGFESVIQGITYKPQQLLLLDYPEYVEVFSLRKENRVDCFLPATLLLDDNRLDVHILNISTGGCRLGLPQDEARDHPLKPDQHLRCEFQMLGFAERPNEFSGVVRTVAMNKGKCFLGVEFTDMPEQLQQHIRQYVVNVGEYLGDVCPSDL